MKNYKKLKFVNLKKDLLKDTYIIWSSKRKLFYEKVLMILHNFGSVWIQMRIENKKYFKNI